MLQDSEGVPIPGEHKAAQQLEPSRVDAQLWRAVTSGKTPCSPSPCGVGPADASRVVQRGTLSPLHLQTPKHSFSPVFRKRSLRTACAPCEHRGVRLECLLLFLLCLSLAVDCRLPELHRGHLDSRGCVMGLSKPTSSVEFQGKTELTPLP